LLCLLGILTAPLLVRFLAPGFDQTATDLAVKLTRLLFPYLFLIGLSSTLISILNSHDFFFVPGLSSAFLNLAMIMCLGIYVLIDPRSTIELQITVWSAGVILGGILQTIVNFPLLKKIGYKIRLRFTLKGEALRAVWTRFLPGVIGIAIRQINLAVDLILASLLATGSIAALSYGNRLMQLPLGIFGVSAGVAVLPLFSRFISENNWNELSEKLRFSIISLSLIMLPITAFLVAAGRDIIRLIFLRGAFDLNSLDMTYSALLFYSLGLIFFGLTRLLIPLFYAFGNTSTPVKISAFIVALNIMLNIILMKYMAHAGLALATSLSSMIHYFYLRWKLKRKIPALVFPETFSDLLKISFLAIMILALATFLNFLIPSANIMIVFLKLIIMFLISSLIMLAGVRVLRISYGDMILQRLWKRNLQK
ncbi:MAG: murein biosynthesis integral membrane protein MurJ, partial [Candidatus Cloacimonetes bacterium]|nr:murein biosynthesis integral membrane protein MurJ [Candidatus Cloacimonadota bacterium]